MENKQESNIILKLIIVTCFFTNISQIPYLVDLGITRYIAIPIWIMLFIVIILKKLIRIDRMILYIGILWVYFISFNMIRQIFEGGRRINSTFVYPFTLSVFIFFIGKWIATVIPKDKFIYIANSYIISGLIVTVSVYINKFSSGFSWEDRGYAYVSKNSVSQIILTTIIFLIVTNNYKKFAINLSKWIIVFFITIQLLMLKSRASILGIVIVIGIIILKGKEHKKVRRIICTFSVIFLLLLIINKEFYTFIVNNIIAGGRDLNNLDDLSSGRWSMFISFSELFKNCFMIGVGQYYIESFPLSILMHYGILGGIPLLIISSLPIIYSIFNLHRSDSVSISFVMLALTYTFNGLFEQQAPFGPGTKCYMLWLMFGLITVWNKNKYALSKNIKQMTL